MATSRTESKGRKRFTNRSFYPGKTGGNHQKTVLRDCGCPVCFPAGLLDCGGADDPFRERPVGPHSRGEKFYRLMEKWLAGPLPPRRLAAMAVKKLIEKGNAIDGFKQIACPTCAEVTRASANLCPNCSYVFSATDKRTLSTGGYKRGTKGTSRVRPNDASVFVREMAERGFKYVRHLDGITGELVKKEDDPQIEKLGLQFGAIPKSETDGIYITQTSPQIQVAMSWDKFLELAGIKP